MSKEETFLEIQEAKKLEGEIRYLERELFHLSLDPEEGSREHRLQKQTEYQLQLERAKAAHGPKLAQIEKKLGRKLERGASSVMAAEVAEEIEQKTKKKSRTR